MRLLDLLLPRRCLVCGVVGDLVCGACRGRLPRVRPPTCARCGAPTAWPVARCRECAGRRLAFAAARAAVAYQGPVRTLVGAWKERGLRMLADLAAGLVVETIARPCVTVIAWVPSDLDRCLQRGHHPAEPLPRELPRRRGHPRPPPPPPQPPGPPAPRPRAPRAPA